MESQDSFEQIIEYKKLVSKLEAELETKDNEKNTLENLFNDLKGFAEKLKKELNESNIKIQKLYNEKNIAEKRYEEEIEKLKRDSEKQKEIYEEQILKLASFDPEGMKTRIQNEAEVKFKQIINQKDLEIDGLNGNLLESRKQIELLRAEFETFKSDAARELRTKEDLHQTELNDLLHKIEIQNDKVVSNVDREAFKEIKNELDAQRRHVNELTNEITNLRKEKEQLTIERNELKMNSMKSIDQDKFSIKMLTTDNERNSNLIVQLKGELTLKEDQLKEKKQEVKDLIKDKADLIKKIHESENEFISFKTEIVALRGRIERYEKEMSDQQNKIHQEHKEVLFRKGEEEKKNHKDLKELQQQLSETKMQLTQFYQEKQEEKNEYECNYQKLKFKNEELIEEMTKIQNYCSQIEAELEDKNEAVSYLENEYRKLQNLHRGMTQTATGGDKYQKLLQEKEREIKSLKEKNKFSREDTVLREMYESVVKKKQYYKEKCKEANKNIQNILQKIRSDPKKFQEEIAF